jgi:predicted permease
MTRGHIRSRRPARGVFVVAFVTLTLAIAAATTTFSVVDAIVLRSLPFPGEDRLVAIGRTSVSNPRPSVVSPQDFFAWRDGATRSFSALAATGFGGSVQLDPDGEMLTRRRVSSDFFDVLGVRPIVGRGFTPDEEFEAGLEVAVVSHRLWISHFGGDPAAIGTTASFGRESRRIVGVLPPDITYPIGPASFVDVWIPFVANERDRDPAARGRGYSLEVVGRLKDGVTVDQARVELVQVRERFDATYPNTFWQDYRVYAEPLRDHVIGPAKGWMLLVLGAVALVLLVACANVANLLLVRATVRQRDMALRTALGASRQRLFIGVLLESAALAAASAAAGLLASYWAVGVARASLPEGLARASDIALDGRVVVAAVVATTMTALICGLAPAWQGARADVVTLLKGEGAARSGGWRVRNVFLVAEVALVLMLLVGTALLVTSFVRVRGVDLGFNPDNLVAFSVRPSIEADDDDDAYRRLAATFYAGTIERALSVPGVTSAAVYDGTRPLSSGGTTKYSIPGFGTESGDDMVAMRSMSPGYLETAGMRVVEGRAFRESDGAGSQRVAVVNDVVARRYFPDRTPVGETVDFRGPIEIVGVVAAVWTDGPEVEPGPELFFPVAQHPQPSGWSGHMLVARTAGPPAAVAPALEAALGDALPATPAARAPYFYGDSLDRLTAQRRFSAWLMTLFGGLALLIGAAGVYAVMASVVQQRTREIGIRVAIGASSGRVLRSVLVDAARYLGAGLVLGVAAAWAASGLIASILFEVAPTDPAVYLAAAAVLFGAGLLAAVIPAVRAARVDPLVALRAE